MSVQDVTQRVASAALLFFTLVCMLGDVVLVGKPSFAAVSIVERPEEELLILELHINDNVRGRGFLAYLPADADLQETLIPLRALSKAISVAITVDPSEGIAQGFYLSEDNIFQLDLRRQIVLTKGQELPIAPGDAEAHYDDIYVRASRLLDWFDLDVRADIGTLRLFVKSSSTLPYEEELEREKRAALLKKRTLTEDPPYDPSQFLPYGLVSKPSVILQNSLLGFKSPDTDRIQNSYSVQGYGDLGGFGTRFLFSGVAQSEGGHNVQNSRLTFRKRDPARELLGPLNAGSFSVGDVDYPDVPLFVGRKNGLGVSVSSDPQLSVSRSFGPETTLIDGDAPIGWDVELYRNGYFVDFQDVGDDGRFEFEDVELIQGFNLFTIRLFGPEGQKQTQTQRIVRGAEILREGEVSYEFAAGQPEADFLPFAEDRRTDRTFGASGQVFYGFKKYLTLGASVFSGVDRSSTIEATQNAATISAVMPLFGFRNQVRLMRASDDRSGYDLETSTQVAGVNISLGHTSFDGFDEDDRDTDTVTTLTMNKNFGPFSASLQAEDRSFLDEDDEIFVRNSISTKLFGAQLTNTLEKTFSDAEAQENFDGDLAVLMDLWDWRLRSNFLYDFDSRTQQTLQSARISANRKIDAKRSIRINADHNFSSDLFSTDARYNQQFDDFSVDFNVGASSDSNLVAGFTLRTALQPDHEGDYSFVSAREGGLGSVGLRTYLDKNANGQYDEGEDLIEGIGFRSNRGVVSEKTDENGMIFIRGLSESATRFSLSESSLPSIYLKPNVDYVDIFPRRGATTAIDIGFSQLGEVDGFVYRPDKDEGGDPLPAPGILVSLINVETGALVDEMLSEYDGYYIFTPLSLGVYRVIATPRGVGQEKLVKDVILNAERTIQMDQNFVLPEAMQVAAVEPAAGDEAEEITLSAFVLQLGSYTDRALAEKEQAHLTQSGHPAEIQIAEINSKTYHRLIMAVESYQDGKKVCRTLLKNNTTKACFARAR